MSVDWRHMPRFPLKTMCQRALLLGESPGRRVVEMVLGWSRIRSNSSFMDLRVTTCTKCDEIRFIIVARLASKLEMMDFEIFHGTARLASPTVALENFAVQLTISLE
jgi:hypothetical protein